MTTLMHSRWLPILLAAVILALAPAFAQKKKKETPPSSAAAQGEQHPQQKMGSSIKDILLSIQGQQTNHGLLTKVTGDYVVFDSEGDTLMYPLMTIQVVKFLKTEEGEPRKIEIRFLSKD